jgi:hypothetical protein
MPESAASNPSATPTRPRPSANGTATPPVPPGATNAHMRTRRPAVLDRFRMAMTPLRRVMRRTARHS